MAEQKKTTKKSSSSTMKKTTKKVAKKAKKSPIVIILLVLIVIGVCVLVGMSYVKLSPIAEELKDIEAKVEALPDKTSEPIDFFTVNSDTITGEWKVDETYFPTLTTISQPTYKVGNQKTKVTLECKIELNIIDGIVSNLLGFGLTDASFSKDIIILAMEASDSDKVELFKESFDMPNTIYQDMKLQNSSVVYDGLEITWASSNPLVITNEGEITGIGSAKLTATLKLNDAVTTKEFDITVSEIKDIVICEEDFSDYDDSTYVNTDDFSGVSIKGAVSNDGQAKFRCKSDSEVGEILIQEFEIKNISFTYQYVGDSVKNSYTKDSYIELLFQPFTTSDSNHWESLNKVILNDSNIHDFIYTVTEDNNVGIYKVVISTDYATSYIAIDDLKITRDFGYTEVYNAVKNVLPNKLSGNYDLPTTTSFGGAIEYTSDNTSVLTNLGVVTSPDAPTEVKLHVKVTGFSFSCEFDHSVKVIGASNVEAVEVRFIDLNRDGDNSRECGESTYIKIGSIDVLIDAGENTNQTFAYVQECINTYSDDKVLDYVIATHPDSDHIGSMDLVMANFKVLHLITFVENDGDTTGVFKAYKENYLANGCEVCTSIDSYNNVGSCTRRVDLATDVYIEIINTGAYELAGNAANDNNGRSIVCVLNAYGTRILFTGDAENLGRDIESNTKDEIGNVDILKVVHHGTKNGCSEEYLKVVDPEVAIICNGAYLGNKHGHPTYEAITSLYGYDKDMLVYTISGGTGDDSANCELGTSYVCKGNSENSSYQRNGMITVTIDDNGYTISSANYGENLIQIKDTDFYKSMEAAYK